MKAMDSKVDLVAALRNLLKPENTGIREQMGNWGDLLESVYLPQNALLVRMGFRATLLYRMLG